MKLTRTAARKGCFALAILLMGSCRQASDLQPTAPDNRGQLIADLPAPFYRLLDWSVDGQELYYWVYYQFAPINKGNYHLYALNVQTGGRRLVYDDPLLLSTDYQQSVQSPDGKFFYFTARRYKANQPPVYFLYRISARQANQAVVVDSSYDALHPTNPYIPRQLLSVDGTRLVFQHRPDSIRIHQVGTKMAVAYPASVPVAFSPDASRLLLQQYVGQNQGTWDMALSDLSEKPVDTSIPRGQYPYANSGSDNQWHTEGIRYLYGNSVPGPSGLFLWNVTQQKSTLLRTLPEGESFVSGLGVKWSQDGRRIVFWSSPNVFSMDNLRRFLYTTDVNSLKSDKIATVVRSESERNSILGPLLLSYDKAQVAYSLDGKVYVVAIP